MLEMFKNDRIIVTTGLAWCPKPAQLHYMLKIGTPIFAQGLKVKCSLKIRTEYGVVIGCNHVLSVAGEVKLSYVGYSHIHYFIYSYRASK